MLSVKHDYLDINTDTGITFLRLASAFSCSVISFSRPGIKAGWSPGAPFINMVNFNPSMDKLLHPR